VKEGGHGEVRIGKVLCPKYCVQGTRVMEIKRRDREKDNNEGKNRETEKDKHRIMPGKKK